MPGVGPGDSYKYEVTSRFKGYKQMKADPYGFAMEVPPKSASIVVDTHRYQWQDQEWLQKRAETHLLDEPVSIYEVHLGSWMREKTIGSLPTANWPTSWCRTSSGWATRTSN